MFTIDALDDHPQTRMLNAKRLVALGLADSAYLAHVADNYRAYLLERFGLRLTRRSAITRCEFFKR